MKLGLTLRLPMSIYLYKQKPSLPLYTKPIEAPTEVWLQAMQFCDQATLVKLRRVSKQWCDMSNHILSARLQEEFAALVQTTDETAKSLADLRKATRTDLDRYRTFLSADYTSAALQEVSWYSNPCVEVITVCECLCRLKGDVPLPDTERLSWSQIRSIMKRPRFRVWGVGLAVNVESISIVDTRRVEKIIRTDPMITYERLAEVSQRGYQLLILVAAALQYTTITEQIHEYESEKQRLESCKNRMRNFLEAIVI